MYIGQKVIYCKSLTGSREEAVVTGMGEKNGEAKGFKILDLVVGRTSMTAVPHVSDHNGGHFWQLPDEPAPVVEKSAKKGKIVQESLL